MAKSLQDQLLNAGLVDKKKAKNIKKMQRISQRAPTAESEEGRLRAQQVLQDKAERDKALNQQKNNKAEQKAVIAQIKQLINVNKIKHGNGDIAYQFSDGKNIKKIYVNELLQAQLIGGVIAVVRKEGGYTLVPRAIAEKVAQRDDAFVVVLNDKSSEQQNDDDPYADYKIPDDLMW